MNYFRYIAHYTWEEIKFQVSLIKMNIYEKIYGPEKTCEKYGHEFIYPASAGLLPPKMAYCKCCKKRFEIEYQPDFMKDGPNMHEVEKFHTSRKEFNDNEWVEKNWY